MRFRGRIIFFLARLAPNLLGVALTAVLTRVLGPSDYGLYALGLSIVLFVTMGVFEWLGLSVLRMAPTVDDPALFFGTVLTFFCLLCLTSIFAATLILVFAGLQNYALLTLACLSTAVVAAWFELQQRLQMSELRETDYLLSSLGRCAAGFAFVCVSASVSGNAALIVVSLGASFVIGSCIRRDPRLMLRKVRFSPSCGWMLFRFGFPLSISIGLATIVSGVVDKWLLQGLLGSHAVGLLTAATMVAQVPIKALAGAIGPWSYSMAVKALTRSPEEGQTQLTENFIILIAIVFPAAAGVIALSNNLADLVVGETYREAAIVLTPWLAAAAVATSVRSFYFDAAFQLANRTSRLIWTMAVALGVNVALDICLIPRFGELGAAIGMFGASLVGLAVTAIASISVFRLPIPVTELVKIVISTAIMFLVLQKVISHYSGALALACQIGVGSLVYLGGIIASDVHGIRRRLMVYLMMFVKPAPRPKRYLTGPPVGPI